MTDFQESWCDLMFLTSFKISQIIDKGSSFVPDIAISLGRLVHPLIKVYYVVL